MQNFLTIFSKISLYFLKLFVLSALLFFVMFWENFGYFNILFFLLLFFLLFQESKENLEFSSQKAAFFSCFASLMILGQFLILEAENYTFIFFIFPLIFLLSSFIFDKKDLDNRKKNNFYFSHCCFFSCFNKGNFSFRRQDYL